MRPGRRAILRNGDVVCSEEDGSYAIDVYELGGEWGGVWGRDGGAGCEVFEGRRRDTFGQDALVGVEFEGLC